ncbi:hypothetical protein JCM10213_002067 [Rhodosporidiobolus nylandii]
MAAPTPSAADDAAILAVLERAKELHASLDPLHTWEELCGVIGSCQLAALSRQPEFEALYAQEFGPLVRRTYGSMEKYLRKQLGWAPDAADEGEYWLRTGRTNVRRNDWPYGIPRDVSHWVVWVPLPLFHPALCTPAPTRPSTPLPPSQIAAPSSSDSSSGTSTPSGLSRTNPLAHDHVAPTKGTWDYVSRNGLSGLTGEAERRWRERQQKARGQDGEAGGAGAEDEEEDGPEREVAAFVRSRWREEDGWETAWFANPPALQSVPGLAHFHVLARKTERRGSS